MSPTELARRLETGWQMIDAECDFNRRADLERHWLQLLAEYERACDSLPAADRTPQQSQQSEMRVA